MIMALTSSGPVPSPLIIAAVLVNQNKKPILATYIYFELNFIRPKKLSLNGGDLVRF
jgi:hypothetical protein